MARLLTLVRHLAIVGVTFGSVFGMEAGWACACELEEVRIAKQNADIVFAGKVTNVTFVDTDKEREPRILVEFAVDRVWKGPVGKTFTMHTNLQSSSCTGISHEILTVGNDLIVYGYAELAKGWKTNGAVGAGNAAPSTVRDGDVIPTRNELLASLDDKRTIYSTNVCTRTRTIANAAEDINQLGKTIQFAK